MIMSRGGKRKAAGHKAHKGWEGWERAKQGYPGGAAALANRAATRSAGSATTGLARGASGRDLRRETGGRAGPRPPPPCRARGGRARPLSGVTGRGPTGVARAGTAGDTMSMSPPAANTTGWEVGAGLVLIALGASAAGVVTARVAGETAGVVGVGADTAGVGTGPGARGATTAGVCVAGTGAGAAGTGAGAAWSAGAMTAGLAGARVGVAGVGLGEGPDALGTTTAGAEAAGVGTAAGAGAGTAGLDVLVWAGPADVHSIATGCFATGDGCLYTGEGCLAGRAGSCVATSLKSSSTSSCGSDEATSLSTGALFTLGAGGRAVRSTNASSWKPMASARASGARQR